VTASTYDVAVVGLGALGSATAYELARRGASVVGIEQFRLGHHRGASHDTSRILRRSYHTPGYVRLAAEAYDDWQRLSAAAGEPLVITTGGLDFFPPDAAIPMADYTASLAACDVPFDVLDTAEVARRWPQISLPPGTRTLHQADTGIVHAARTVALLQRLARSHGAELVDETRAAVVGVDEDGVAIDTGGDRIRATCAVVTADAWTNDVLSPLGVRLPLTVTQEQVTYFAPDRPADFEPGKFPVWIWMDDPSFYGFPTYGEPLVKAGQDVGGKSTTAADRDFTPDPANERQLTEFMARTFPGSTRRIDRTVTCLYTLTPDRDFVVDTLPDAPVAVGLAAGHGFKFTPTLGRILADLALAELTVSDIAPFALGRAALTDADRPVSWLV
jgi:sarcosine oxidase